MKRLILFIVVVFSAGIVLPLTDALAFGEIAGACEKDCLKCHQLTKEEAGGIMNALAPNLNIEVVNVRMSPVSGLWEVALKVQGKKEILYLDFSKGKLIQGAIIDIKNRVDITSQRRQELAMVDVSVIPLGGAIVMGNKDAKHRVIVFTDVDCSFCKKLHLEMKKVMEKTKDIVFFIKLYPLQIHPPAYEKSKAISCEKSLKLLDDAFDGKSLPKPSCEDKEVDENIKLAQELGISSTPTIILPEGNVIPGSMDAETLMKLILKPQPEQIPSH